MTAKWAVVPRFLALAALLGLLGMPQARAEMQGATSPAQDPRKAKESKVVSDVGTPDDEKRKDDSDRMNDSYEPKGIPLGSFLFLPKVELDGVYNSNVFAQHRDAKPDLLTIVRPQAKLRSNFSRHALNFSAEGDEYLYRHYTHDNHFDAEGRADGRLDITDSTEATATAQAYSRHEDRSSPDEAGGKTPTPVYGWASQAGLDQRYGRYRFQLGGDAQRMKFGDVEGASGSMIHNGDRNRIEVIERARGSYELFPGYAAVTELSLNQRSYDLSRDDDGYRRDSSGYRAEAGIGVDISQLLRGDFLVGYLAQDYTDSRLSDPAGLSFKASFNWTPDAATIVIPSLERSVLETTTVGSSSIVRSAAAVTVRREVLRNLIATGLASFNMDTQEGVKNRDSWTAEGRARLTYSFSPMMFVASELDHKHKVSDTSTSSFNQTIITLRLGVQM